MPPTKLLFQELMVMNITPRLMVDWRSDSFLYSISWSSPVVVIKSFWIYHLFLLPTFHFNTQWNPIGFQAQRNEYTIFHRKIVCCWFENGTKNVHNTGWPIIQNSHWSDFGVKNLKLFMWIPLEHSDQLAPYFKVLKFLKIF